MPYLWLKIFITVNDSCSCMWFDIFSDLFSYSIPIFHFLTKQNKVTHNLFWFSSWHCTPVSLIIFDIIPYLLTVFWGLCCEFFSHYTNSPFNIRVALRNRGKTGWTTTPTLNKTISLANSSRVKLYHNCVWLVGVALPATKCCIVIGALFTSVTMRALWLDCRLVIGIHVGCCCEFFRLQ